MTKKNQPQQFGHEFSRPQFLDQVPPTGLSLELAATVEECQAVAQRLGLVALSSLTARLKILRADADSIQVDGTMVAEATQECVVTLRPLPVTLNETIHGMFMPAAAIADLNSNGSDGLDEIIEPIIGGAIDCGELVVQHLALALDPYPRAPDAKLQQSPATKPPQPSGRANPFEKLHEILTGNTQPSGKKGDRR
jgi:uncharacterized metal-binding protein YceD (DUF177 family)